MRRILLVIALLAALLGGAPVTASAHSNVVTPPQCFTGSTMLGNVSTSGYQIWSSVKGGDCLHRDEQLVRNEYTLSAGFWWGGGWCVYVYRPGDGWHGTYRAAINGSWFLFAQGDSRQYNVTAYVC